jgi:uncharacterized protein (DUF2147 family)
MWSKQVAILSTIIYATLARPAHAIDPVGVWLTEDGEARVQIFNCGQALCGKIISLKEPNEPETGQPKLDKFNKDSDRRALPIVGLQIMSDLKPAGRPDRWEGTLYNPEEGNTYRGVLTIRGARGLELQGCVFAGLICKSEVWKRTN